MYTWNVAYILLNRCKSFSFFSFFFLYCISSDNSVLPDVPIDNVTYILEYIQGKSWSSILHVVVICCEYSYLNEMSSFPPTLVQYSG